MSEEQQDWPVFLGLGLERVSILFCHTDLNEDSEVKIFNSSFKLGNVRTKFLFS